MAKLLDALQPSLNSTLLTIITPSTPSYPIYYTDRPSYLPFISDKNLAIATPTIVYWIASLVFHTIDTLQLSFFEKYRIHESPEVLARNKVTVKQVIHAVLWQQVVQCILGVLWLEEEQRGGLFEDDLGKMAELAPKVAWGALLVLGRRTGEDLLRKHGEKLVQWMYWWGLPAAQLFFGFFLLDTYQYFIHRLFHSSRFLYRQFHSYHHRLYVPYAFGALYNHPLEGLLFDTLGSTISHTLSGMSVRQASLFFGFSSAKTVDDHCGYKIWWDPLQFLFANNADYHDIHHQVYGLKKNFSQPYFTNWDKILGTLMTREQANAKVRPKIIKDE